MRFNPRLCNCLCHRHGHRRYRCFEVAIFRWEILQWGIKQLRGPIDRELPLRSSLIYQDKSTLKWKETPNKMTNQRHLKRRKSNRDSEEEGEQGMRSDRLEISPTRMSSPTIVPMPCCFSAPSTAHMGATASYVLIIEAQNRVKLKTDWKLYQTSCFLHNCGLVWRPQIKLRCKIDMWCSLTKDKTE